LFHEMLVIFSMFINSKKRYQLRYIRMGQLGS
jgi:hypothetical protein